MKRGLALIATLCLVLGFQNCAQNTMQTSDLTANEVSVNLPPSSSNGEEASSGASGKVTYVEIPNISDEASVSGKATELTPYRLVISVQSGSIDLVDDTNAVLQKRCLDSGSLQELKTILGGASICAAANADGEICAMKYTPGYASLYVNEKRVNLGEEQDSCGKGRKDLCGALTDVFQAYVSHVKQHWTEMNCE
ncbi:hypothetical protein [Bdellovibrio sp. HCB-110]|uniref:hypothetical protein n=1 Tax=Bdellovibrio sp. HCB-110 TaxID=3391182 RepID=UPI0039B4CE75